jgi:hypothetical protein
MTPPKFVIRPGVAIHWTSSACGNPGCTDPECGCALCRRPIGVADSDPRWEEHDEDCNECELCRDSVPIILFRGEGKTMEQAQFHIRCFEEILVFDERQV